MRTGNGNVSRLFFCAYFAQLSLMQDTPSVCGCNPVEMQSREIERRTINTKQINIMNEQYSDLHRCHLWIVNDIIVSLWDFDKKRPAVEDVKNNWRFDGLQDVNDAEILDIIERVAKFY